MDKDLSELIKYLDEKFSNVSDKLDNLQKTKAEKVDLNNLIDAVDAYAKKADTYFQEMVALSHKVDRLEKQIHQIAKKVGINLEE